MSPRTCVHHGEEPLVDEGYYRCLCPDQHRLVATGIEVDQIVTDIIAELERAERKFPGWPDDLIHGAAIMAEESGEAVRACLQVVYQDGDPDAYRQELVRTAAMCLRALVDLGRRTK